MKGLLRKDIYLMGNLGKSYLLIASIFLVLSVAGVYDATFAASFLSVLCIMMPVNVFAYDEQAKWDKYAAALPSGRAGVVGARYLFTLIVGLSAMALVAVIHTVLFFLGRSEAPSLLDAVFSSLFSAAFGILMNALLLPLLFKFGAQKGRIYLMVVMGCCVGATFGALAFFSQVGIQLSTAALPLTLLPVLCVLSLIPSYFLSLGIYRKKDL